MKTLGFLLASLAGASLFLAAVVAEEPVKSGPQVGQDVPGPFHPLNVTGAQAGKKNCLYCQNGAAPVAVVFARRLTPSVTKLIKKIDAATAENKKAGMGSFVVFLSNDEDLTKNLQALASKEKINNTILSIDNPAGPEQYRIAKDADVTVLLYKEFTVRSNCAFRAGELNEKGISRILSDMPKIASAN